MSHDDETRPALAAWEAGRVSSSPLERSRPASQIDMSLTDMVHGVSWNAHSRISRLERWRRLIRVPDSELRARWDIAVVGLVGYTLMMVPYSSAFLATLGGSLLAVDYTIDAIFLVDIALNVRTYQYEHSGDLITDGAAVAKMYLSGWFAIDAVAALPTFIELAALAGASERPGGAAASGAVPMEAR